MLLNIQRAWYSICTRHRLLTKSKRFETDIPISNFHSQSYPQTHKWKTIRQRNDKNEIDKKKKKKQQQETKHNIHVYVSGNK